MLNQRVWHYPNIRSTVGKDNVLVFSLQITLQSIKMQYIFMLLSYKTT